MTTAKIGSQSARARARRNAVQAIYQWHMTQRGIDEIASEFALERTELIRADKAYFNEILSGVGEHANVINENLAPFLDRDISDVDVVERSILQLGMYELLYQIELPWRVVINEAVDLAKMFGAEQSYKYINAVLDRAARKLRSIEVSQVRR